MFFGNIVTFGVVRMVGAKGSLFSVKELKMNQSRIPSDMWKRPRGPERQEFQAHFKIMKNGYWENVMYSQLTLHAASNLICTSTGKNLLTMEIFPFPLLQFSIDRCAGRLT